MRRFAHIRTKSITGQWPASQALALMKYSTKLALVALGSFPLSAFLEIYTQENSILFAHLIFLAFISFGWCAHYSDERSIQPPVGSKLLCGLIPILGVPVYFLRTHQIKYSALKILSFTGFVVLCIILYGLPYEFIQR